jgi:hypothetical protein
VTAELILGGDSERNGVRTGAECPALRGWSSFCEDNGENRQPNGSRDIRPAILFRPVREVRELLRG